MSMTAWFEDERRSTGSIAARRLALLSTVCLSIGAATALPAMAAAPNEPVCVAVGGAALQRGGCGRASMSAEGRYVAFVADAWNIVTGDTNRMADVFVRDMSSGTTSRASVSRKGYSTDGFSDPAMLSGNGRFVAFASVAKNILSGDTNGQMDVFVRDLDLARTYRVSVGSGGVQADGGSGEPTISGDGRTVAFISTASNLVPGHTRVSKADIFVRYRGRDVTERVSVSSSGIEGNGYSMQAAISADGRFVAFASASNNLVTGDSNSATDVFVRDLVAGSTERVSLGQGNTQGNGYSILPAISADGRYVAFVSAATNLVPGDTNGMADVFVRDRQAGTTERINLATSGAQGNKAIFERPAISGDGRLVAFVSEAKNMVRGDTNGLSDVFLRDRTARTTTRINVGPKGVQANRNSAEPSLSTDGRYIA